MALGALLYVLKIPERFYPKTFDVWLSSHSIFHWTIVVGALILFWSSLRTFHERQIFPCPETGRILTPQNYFSANSSNEEL